jgi:N-glycosylase/DNA lyase
MSTRPSARLEVLHDAHRRRGADVRRRLQEFAAVPAEDYFFELVYCLLTPQSSAANAARAVEQLREADRNGRLDDAARILARKECYIRFHNTKARNIAEARRNFPEIAERLSQGMPSPDLRRWLIASVRGLGWKEASHFLRNIGHRDLAILDRHILKHLKRHGVIRSVPVSLTPVRYQSIERAFRRFANAVDIPMDELDLLFWSEETGVILK